MEKSFYFRQQKTVLRPASLSTYLCQCVPFSHDYCFSQSGRLDLLELLRRVKSICRFRNSFSQLVAGFARFFCFHISKKRSSPHSLGRFHLKIPEIRIFSSGRVFEFLLPFDHLYQARSGPDLCKIPVGTCQLSSSQKIRGSFGFLEVEIGEIDGKSNTYRGVDVNTTRFVP